MLDTVGSGFFQAEEGEAEETKREQAKKSSLASVVYEK